MSQITELQARYEAAEVFTDEHIEIGLALIDAVTNDALNSISQGVMPVYRVSDSIVIALHPSSKNADNLQVSRYAKVGMLGDSQYGSVEGAVRSEGIWFLPRLTTEEAEQFVVLSIRSGAVYQPL